MQGITVTRLVELGHVHTFNLHRTLLLRLDLSILGQGGHSALQLQTLLLVLRKIERALDHTFHRSNFLFPLDRPAMRKLLQLSR